MENKININNPHWITNKETKIELDWWENDIIPRSEFSKAIKKKWLIRLKNTGKTYRLTYRLRKEMEYPFAKKETELAIEEIGLRWRKNLRKELPPTLDPNNFYLSVFSLYRDEEQQMELKKQTSNANDTSSHQAGAAADIDPQGFYYFNTETGKFNPINTNTSPPINILLKKLSKVLEKTLLEIEEEKLINFYSEYNPRKEKELSTLSCFHVSPNPKIHTMLTGTIK